jgi:tryptophan halogenase
MKIKSLTIVGGGTAGWLAAAFLSYNHKELKINLIDKDVPTPIGVGEATLLTFRGFLEESGFDISEWFIDLDAGYKSGIMFSNWSKKGHDIWHPFMKGNRNLNDQIMTWDAWSLNQDLDFKKYCLGMHDSSVIHNTVDMNSIESYAYHVDCGKLTKFIREKIKNKINLIYSDVVNIDKTENNIERLFLKNGQIIESDLFLDCTGFLSLLKESKKIDLSDRLFVNTAVVCPIPYKNRKEEFKPYAICEAVDHGWIWKIGVNSRIGSGMVFNRNITDIDEAKRYFVDHWDHRISVDNVRHINWDPFYVEDQWAGNIVSIGLSSGFIEPLESTSIGLMTYSIAMLSNSIKESYITDLDIKVYNNNMMLTYEDCIDFVSAHYANNERTSDFWNYVRRTFVPSSRMNHHVELLLDENASLRHSSRWNYMFGNGNWILLLQQLGYPISPRKINLPNENVREFLIRSYIEHEKNRHIWSRHHSTEVDRLHETYKK